MLTLPSGIQVRIRRVGEWFVLEFTRPGRHWGTRGFPTHQAALDAVVELA